MKRCAWVTSDPLYINYHDEEWGVPVYDDRKHFEFLVLESAQAGLSWLTVLKRREGYRELFANFDPAKVAEFTDKDVERLVNEARIIRNRAKIKAAINNAKIFLEIQEEMGSFNEYIWQFVYGKQIVNSPKTPDEIQATSPESDALSLDLKKRGMTFVGSTIMYAHMQACGLVNDHQQSCFRQSICII